MSSANYLSYRDHDASVVKVDNTYYRIIFQSYQKEYEHLMKSGLYGQLQKNKLIISHQEIQNSSTNKNIHKTLLPEQIDFICYPFEWTHSQWILAAETYVEINKIALTYGMILKDATPYNFYFKGEKAVLLDTTSFIFYQDGQSWIAYKQFCEDFLGPLLLMHYNGKDWIRILTSKSELSLPFISKQLPTKSWLSLTVLIHIHLHSKYFSVREKKTNPKKGLTKRKIEVLLDTFLSKIHKFKKKGYKAEGWVNYYISDLESENYLPSKEKIIHNWLHKIKAASVLDLGANTGYFSKVFSKITERVIAIENDTDSIESLAKWVREENVKNVHIVNADITNPSPGKGFMNLETIPLLERCRSELLLGLAIIHHLFFTKRLSLLHIAELFNYVSSKYAIIEFVPENDKKVQLLIKSAPINRNPYSEEIFLDIFSKFFNCIESQEIEGSKRKLFLLEKKCSLSMMILR